MILDWIDIASSVIASEAKQSRATSKNWIASSQALLATTELAAPIQPQIVPT
jgi:hypothetical protein